MFWNSLNGKQDVFKLRGVYCHLLVLKNVLPPFFLGSGGVTPYVGHFLSQSQ